MKHKSVDTNTKKKKGRIHTTVLEAMKSEEAMLKLQSKTKLEPLSGVVRSNSAKKKASSKCWSLEVDRWLEPWRLTVVGKDVEEETRRVRPAAIQRRRKGRKDVEEETRKLKKKLNKEKNEATFLLKSKSKVVSLNSILHRFPQHAIILYLFYFSSKFHGLRTITMIS
ncbi:hypothetical protein L2E82_28506 [Cichorium intybus]|uniref:Uncharacterized protein n=1 Tax=Cichorium intybus TaxID=13427 RepID=A0ACB9CVX9_CICIN|nr:hypothetical protein L2E82_28506 [Cichorium intybus]